ncbi:hemin ABC transporter substrate-binding protein [Microbacterium pseudoresistens]|uniref:Iron complex transport system substrate-binding protein n=1 Tax=Microbacterium pseudoresistens TaxID=640634 RepID=A0A7Y9ETS1_9MICO|nr:ABC transporter substrate-binding protein [Microbacterium pseudoresistens]NYD53805.1 iron complex transport system substrate-binding protein [Microbacterium pseudoresistens]
MRRGARPPRHAARLLALVIGAGLLAGTAGCAASAAEHAPAAPPATAATALPGLDELVPVEDPRAWEGPSTALLDDVAVEPVAADPRVTLPVTVTSHDQAGDVEVTIDDTSRLLAIDRAGSLAATVWGLGLGDLLIGRDAATTFPGTEDLPVVTGSGHTVDVERIVALAPTAVLTDGSIGPRDVVEQLRDVGIPVVFLDNEPSFDGAAQLARDVAAALGAPESGELLAARITDDVAAVTSQIAGITPADPADRVRMLFLYVRGSAGVYYLFGEESGADALITALGGVDVAGELGWEGMRPMTDEAMVAADPDLILVMTHGIESAGGVDGLIEEKTALAVTAAGQHRRFVDMDDAQILSFGPHSAGVLTALARAVYAPDLTLRAEEPAS